MHSEKQTPISPALMMSFSVLAASTAAIFIRFAQEEAPSLVVAAWRLSIGTLIIAPFGLIKSWHTLRQMKRSDWALGFLSGLFLALHFACWIISLEYTTVASSVMLVTMSPLLVALLSTFILREPLSGASWFGLAVALAGSALVAFGDVLIPGSGSQTGAGSADQNGSQILGNMLAFAGAVFVAGYLIIGRKLRASLPLAPYAFVVFGTAALVLLTATLVNHEPMGGYKPVTFLWLLLLGLIPQVMGHVGLNWALRYLPASLVSIALLGEPVGSSIFAMILLGERPVFYELIGGVMILSGIALATWQRASKRLQR